jgi:hypothetical protein
MKKLYQSSDFTRFNARRSERVQRKLNEVKKKTNKGPKKSLLVSQKQVIIAPPCLSIIENTAETMEFFVNFERSAYVYHNIYIDLQGVEQITPEAILYILSLLERMKKHPKTINVGGNAPVSQNCRQIFINSGFYDYVGSNYYETPKDNKILSIRSANVVDGEIASQVIEFASGLLGLSRSRSTKAFYTTILECMGNTKEHAYSTSTAKYAKWWLVALYDEEGSKIQFSILDNGLGIPETVRRRWFEKVIGIKDSVLLKSVLGGSFRTSTGLSYRGKGLPKIMSFKNDKIIQDLVVVSNNGCYFADKDLCVEIAPKFSGTLICWSFIQGSSNDNFNS